MTPIETAASPTDALPWPILPDQVVHLSADELQEIEALAASLRSEQPELSSDWFAQKGVRAGWRPGPTVYLEDHRSITLSTEARSLPFEYRMLGLAGDKDIYLISGERDRAFETYMRSTVGLGAPTVVDVTDAPELQSQRIAEETRRDAWLAGRLADLARQAGGMNFLSYITSDDVWALAVDVAERSGVPVCVAGPPPAVSACANDKLWFVDVIERLLGGSALPKTYGAYNLSQAAQRVKEIAAVSDKIVLKLPSSAGGLGNISLAAPDIAPQSLESVARMLAAQLAALGWRAGSPLLVGEWEQDVLSSPSAQIWIPAPDAGLPILEGLFIQSVAGPSGAFVGAQRADLPKQVADQMAHDAVQIAALMQALGYFGRLSLDALLLDHGDGNILLHWIEANARWGGVSIPMTITNRISRKKTAQPLMIVQRHSRAGNSPDFSDKLKALDALLLRKNSLSDSGLVFLLPPDGRHILFAAIGDSMLDAKRIADEALEVLD